MPPKDNIQLGPGKMYFNTPDGIVPLGDVQEVTLEPVEDELDINGDPLPRIIAEPQGFTGTITLTEEAAEAFRKIAAIAEAAWRVLKQVIETFKEMVDTCPNRRVVHLAMHGSPRVRKKNIKRIVRYYKKMRKD